MSLNANDARRNNANNNARNDNDARDTAFDPMKYYKENCKNTFTFTQKNRLVSTSLNTTFEAMKYLDMLDTFENLYKSGFANRIENNEAFSELINFEERYSEWMSGGHSSSDQTPCPSEEELEAYHNNRSKIIPELISKLALEEFQKSRNLKVLSDFFSTSKCLLDLTEQQLIGYGVNFNPFAKKIINNTIKYGNLSISGLLLVEKLSNLASLRGVTGQIGTIGALVNYITPFYSSLCEAEGIMRLVAQILSILQGQNSGNQLKEFLDGFSSNMQKYTQTLGVKLAIVNQDINKRINGLESNQAKLKRDDILVELKALIYAAKQPNNSDIKNYELEKALLNADKILSNLSNCEIKTKKAKQTLESMSQELADGIVDFAFYAELVTKYKTVLESYPLYIPSEEVKSNLNKYQKQLSDSIKAIEILKKQPQIFLQIAKQCSTLNAELIKIMQEPLNEMSKNLEFNINETDFDKFVKQFKNSNPKIKMDKVISSNIDENEIYENIPDILKCACVVRDGSIKLKHEILSTDELYISVYFNSQEGEEKIFDATLKTASVRKEEAREFMRKFNSPKSQLREFEKFAVEDLSGCKDLVNKCKEFEENFYKSCPDYIKLYDLKDEIESGLITLEKHNKRLADVRKLTEKLSEISNDIIWEELSSEASFIELRKTFLQSNQYLTALRKDYVNTNFANNLSKADAFLDNFGLQAAIIKFEDKLSNNVRQIISKDSHLLVEAIENFATKDFTKIPAYEFEELIKNIEHHSEEFPLLAESLLLIKNDIKNIYVKKFNKKFDVYNSNRQILNFVKEFDLNIENLGKLYTPSDSTREKLKVLKECTLTGSYNYKEYFAIMDDLTSEFNKVKANSQLLLHLDTKINKGLNTLKDDDKQSEFAKRFANINKNTSIRKIKNLKKDLLMQVEKEVKKQASLQNKQLSDIKNLKRGRYKLCKVDVNQNQQFAQFINNLIKQHLLKIRHDILIQVMSQISDSDRDFIALQKDEGELLEVLHSLGSIIGLKPEQLRVITPFDMLEGGFNLNLEKMIELYLQNLLKQVQLVADKPTNEQKLLTEAMESLSKLNEKESAEILPLQEHKQSFVQA